MWWRTMAMLAALAVSVDVCVSAPPANSTADVEATLERFLNAYYDRYLKKRVEEDIRPARAEDDTEDDPYETMQGDQPVENNIGSRPYGLNSTVLYRSNFTDQIQYIEATRNRRRRLDLNERTKENFILFLKKNLMDHLGRGNFSMPKHNDSRLMSINISEIMPQFLNSSNLYNDEITEKIRSFYPSCELPVNTDQDAWKDDHVMNLFFNFNFDYISNDKNANIATATLRLYRLPDNGTQFNSRDGDCDNLNSTEDERLLRVSIYWYTKSLKKRRVRRRLADSKVIPEHSRWVELSVKPAAKAWTKGRNLGLGVLVEDQDDNLLRADKYFKGASCMVGTSTPKPIPTIIIDAARKTNELHGINKLFGRNSTSTVYSDVHLLPTIDICTLEFPENYTLPPHDAHLRIHACNLHKRFELAEQLEEKERRERLAALPGLLGTSSRHIRHQRQYLSNKNNDNEASAREFDPRSRIVGATPLFTRDEWQNFTNSNKFNFSTVNR
ncbi:uncharacterized protein LOC108903742 [Anoplophora glabripennis]|uniref:uncharacterized protein LOC108903742 n=1 Tax=Anoplophora glabripennis TaxID=217634 RepID=UPI0008740406|nr:uncharacterized protein LOC108903742 [Anoplophora glabripennis]